MAFTLSVSKAESAATVLSLEGKLTVGEACETLRSAIRRQIDAGDKAIVLDMQKLIYIDSAGLGVLVSCLMATRHSGGDMAVTKVPARIRDLLHVCRLDTIIQLLEQNV